tara:strand:- start:10364 stop:10996 length:633 start_codon:yes stop_codon:yes gene_type:complete
MKKKVILIGTGTNTNQIINEIERCKDVKIEGIVYFQRKFLKKFKNYTILGDLKILKKLKFKKCKILITLGSTSLRKKIATNIVKEKIKNKFFTLISKNCIVSKSANISEGTILMTGCVINSNSKIGKHSLINTSAIIEHDNKIGNFNNIGPNSIIAGGSQTGENVNINISSTVLDKIKICSNVTIGAKSLVNKNVDQSGTYFGVPIKKIK